RTVYRYHRLSKEDKMDLYTQRPDLNTKDRSHLLKQPLLPGGSVRSGSSTPNSGAGPIKSALKKPKSSPLDATDGTIVSYPPHAEGFRGNLPSVESSAMPVTWKALKIGRDDEMLVSPPGSADFCAERPSAPSMPDEVLNTRDSLTTARKSGHTVAPAPPKDIEEGVMDYDSHHTPLSASNLASLSRGGGGADDDGKDGWERGDLTDPDRRSEGTHSSQRSSEKDSIFNADNEGDEDDSSSESEDEEHTLVE
ncbi:unnamed protein product, partial [Symbiodinium microadriaticum]